MPNIYFNDKQISMLNSIIIDYIDIMESGEKSNLFLDKEISIIKEIRDKLKNSKNIVNNKDIEKSMKIAINIINRRENK